MKCKLDVEVSALNGGKFEPVAMRVPKAGEWFVEPDGKTVTQAKYAQRVPRLIVKRQQVKRWATVRFHESRLDAQRAYIASGQIGQVVEGEHDPDAVEVLLPVPL